VNSPTWDNEEVTDAGAVTWADGMSGITGAVNADNSLVGSIAGEYVGSGGVTVLSNGNYVVDSLYWNGGVTAVGAVTWGDGTSGITGEINADNSLVGSSSFDEVGWGGVTALSNGNYVVISRGWDGYVGAVTWGDGTSGITGEVSAANSLVGSTAGDQVGGGGVAALTNGNYAVLSPSWDGYAGAVTWGDGTSGVKGEINAANSLVGSTANNYVGLGGVTALSNGNYVVSSYYWDNVGAADAGAVTWGDGTSGVTGAVSVDNSLVGSTAGDQVGWDGVTALSNGNYVVSSRYWDNAVTVEPGRSPGGMARVGSRVRSAIATAWWVAQLTIGSVILG
jgi:hypothetical protein